MENKIQSFVDYLAYDFIRNGDEDIQYAVDELMERYDFSFDNIHNQAVTVLKPILAFALLHGQEESIKELFEEEFYNYFKFVSHQRIAYILNVSLQRPNDKLTRKLYIPATSTLEDLAITLIGSFNEDEKNVYRFAHNGHLIYDDFLEMESDEDELASNFHLYDIDFEQLTFLYDAERKLIFQFELETNDLQDEYLTTDDIEVLSGSGYGVTPLSMIKKPFLVDEANVNIQRLFFEEREQQSSFFEDLFDDINDDDDDEFDFAENFIPF